MVLIFSVPFILAVLFHREAEAGNYVTMQDELTTELLRDYNKNIKPDHQVTVTVDMFVRDIMDLDMFTGTMDTQLTFRQEWKDSRLEYKDKKQFQNIQFLTLIRGGDPIWVPDTFFRNELEATQHDSLVPNDYIRVYPDGKVLYSTRVSLKTVCQMNLASFPFDEQSCVLQFASYGWTKEDITYVWKQASPIQQPKSFSVSSTMLIESIEDGSCDVKTNTGEYSCLQARFSFSRLSSWIFLVLYIPTIMFLVISWSSVFMSSKHLTARLVLCLVSLLAISLMSFVVNLRLTPPVAYTKSIDVFLGTSILFAFISLVMTIVVITLNEDTENKPIEKGFISRLKTGSLLVRLETGFKLVYPILYLVFFIVYLAASV